MANTASNEDMRAQDSSVEFLLEEYRNIATTHDRMRDVINRMFYYFLLLSAVPFTVATIVFRETEFDIQKLPTSIGWLFTIISASILFLSLACASARFRQNQYAKTVNRIRHYFADHDTQILPYLLLPTSGELPRTNYLGHVFWYLLSMALIGGLYACLGAFSILSYNIWTGFGAFLVYLALFVLLVWFVYRTNFRKAVDKAVEGKRTKTGGVNPHGD